MEVTENLSRSKNETADYPDSNCATTSGDNNPCKTKGESSTTQQPYPAAFYLQKSPLSSLEELSMRLMEVRVGLEEPESYTTVDMCHKEKSTTTDSETRFSRNPRTQNIIVGRGYVDDRPPPPYEPDPYFYQVQAIRPDYGGYNAPPPANTGRSPTYVPNLVDLFDPFGDRRVRNKFIHKVYATLSLQLLMAFGIIACCCFHEPAREFVQQDRVIWILSLIAYMVLVLLIYCVKSVRRTFPANYFLLLLLTLTLGYLIASIAVHIHINAVLMSFGITIGVTLLITFVAWQNWCDVTSWGMIICVASLVVMVFGLIAVIVTLVTKSRVFYLIYACLATVLFCVYLLYDTQQILGGGRIAMSPEEYILGAVTLFVDIMYIFMNILYIFGFSRV